MAYDAARNWETIQWPASTGNASALPSYDAMLTGTYRLNATMSNDPRRVAEDATRRLGYNQRQRIYDNLINRLTPPETIAIERRGQSVTLASTRSPQARSMCRAETI